MKSQRHICLSRFFSDLRLDPCKVTVFDYEFALSHAFLELEKSIETHTSFICVTQTRKLQVTARCKCATSAPQPHYPAPLSDLCEWLIGQ